MFGHHHSWHGHAERHLMRHKMGRGFRHFAEAAFGGPGMGGAGFKVGRMLGAADLQLILLSLLAEKPRHGYELIKALEEHSSGLYAPSPGVVYPALTYLEEIGHASAITEGNKKLYSITEEGRAHLAQNRETADTMLSTLARMGQRMSRAGKLFAEDAAGDDAPRGLRAARDDLRKALHEKLTRATDETEWRRVAEILERAAREIRGK